MKTLYNRLSYKNIRPGLANNCNHYPQQTSALNSLLVVTGCNQTLLLVFLPYSLKVYKTT